MRLSFYRSVTVTQFKLCFDVQRSKHSFAADRSDTNLIDDANMMNKNNAMSVKCNRLVLLFGRLLYAIHC